MSSSPRHDSHSTERCELTRSLVGACRISTRNSTSRSQMEFVENYFSDEKKTGFHFFVNSAAQLEFACVFKKKTTSKQMVSGGSRNTVLIKHLFTSRMRTVDRNSMRIFKIITKRLLFIKSGPWLRHLQTCIGLHWAFRSLENPYNLQYIDNGFPRNSILEQYVGGVISDKFF